MANVKIPTTTPVLMTEAEIFAEITAVSVLVEQLATKLDQNQCLELEEAQSFTEIRARVAQLKVNAMHSADVGGVSRVTIAKSFDLSPTRITQLLSDHHKPLETE